MEGHSGHLRWLLDLGEYVNSRLPESSWIGDNPSPLMLAVRFKKEEIIDFLIKSGAFLEFRDGDGFTPVLCAVMGGNVRNTQRLIEFGADVSKTSFKNDTAMHLAAKNGHTDEIKLLLEYNVNVNAFDRELRTPLMLAARGGNLEATRLLIDNGADVDACDEDSCNALDYAAKENHVDVVQFLISKGGPRIDVMTNKALTMASSLELIKFLVDGGADVNLRHLSGDTLCIMLSQRAIVGQSVTFGADVNTKNDRWETPLLIAVRMNLENVSELLLELGCDAKARDLDSCCSLRYAAQNDNGKLTEMLLKFGADASLKTDRDEVTPLHMAVSSNSCHAAFTLLKHGCDLEVTNSLG